MPWDTTNDDRSFAGPVLRRRLAAAPTLGLAAGLALVLVAVAPPARALTLQEALTELLSDHPQIRSGEKTVQSTSKEIDKALAQFMPTVTVNTDNGLEVIDDPAERAKQSDSEPFRRQTQSATVTMTQNLFNGFATASAAKTARLNTALAEYTLEGTRQQTLFQGVNAYIGVLRQRRLVVLARVNEHTILTQLNLEDERVQRGSGIAVDVLQAKSRLQLSKERRVNFEGGLEDAVTNYAQVFNAVPDIEDMTDPVPPVEFLPSELKTAVEIALRENPAIGNSDATTEVARERRRSIMSQYYPAFDLVSSWNYEKHRGGAIGTQRDYSVRLQSSWNLFSGFSTRANLNQAAFDYSAAKDNLDFVQRQIVQQVRLAWQALLTVRARLELLENAVNIASEVFTSRKALREAGKETVINVLDAENEINNAQINFTAAWYSERVSVYQLLLAMGRLNEAHLKLGGY
jgi:outer membrane protein, adhesin transport system